MDKITKIIKIMTDTLLIAVAYLLIKSYINGYFLSATILINYASTIFIEAVIISFVLQFVIKVIYKNMKRKQK